MAPQAKCYFVCAKDEGYGFYVHAETPGKAKRKAAAELDCLYGDWIYLRAWREPRLDDKPINYHTLRDAGMEMTFEGEPIKEWEITVLCRCPVCNQNRIQKINPVH